MALPNRRSQANLIRIHKNRAAELLPAAVNMTCVKPVPGLTSWRTEDAWTIWMPSSRLSAISGCGYAKTNLISPLRLTEIQATAILDMQLRRLAALERKKIEDEYKAVMRLITHLEDLLANPAKILTVIKDEIG